MIHITANKEVGGNETRIKLLAATDDIVISSGDKETLFMLQKYVPDVRACSLTGFMAPLSLSRVLRHLPEGPNQLALYPGVSKELVEKAINLSGRPGDFSIIEAPAMDFPKVDRQRREEGTVQLLWIGRIKSDCGLDQLIEALGKLNDNPKWHLTVAGNGPAKIASPLLRRTRALEIDKRITWAGWVEDVYPLMDGCTAAIITRRDPEGRTVWHECKAAELPVIASQNAEELHKLLLELL